jgi:acyl-coenzyme A thioesterase PaaI-like protein
VPAPPAVGTGDSRKGVRGEISQSYSRDPAFELWYIRYQENETNSYIRS